MRPMTTAFVEQDECISIVFFFSFSELMYRTAVIWISSPELFHIFHTYAMPISALMRAENL